ncbi:MAG: glycosyltransferase family 4 protein [Dehalococcoidia bacterium]|nr:glycosyltransferase family 4 protein [Dehalococcoidia bacterium]
MTEIALCLEQTLGHRAHGLNLEQAAAQCRQSADVIRVAFPTGRTFALPWALRGSASALQQLRARPPYRAVLFHTQTISLLASLAVRRGRYAVSVDATPVQIDAMGRWYAHRRAPRPLEESKAAVYRRVFKGAGAFVAWSEWAADSLVRDYGVDRARVLVAHPGAPRSFFLLPRKSVSARPRILFVGGDFVRKGGPALLRAFAPLSDRAELVLVTDAPVAPQPGVRVERGVRPGSDRQLRAYAEADVFCLPTRGDCTSVAIGEAMAAGLPVVTTTVGSNAETVTPGESGLLVPPGDEPALTSALCRLVDDASERQRLGLRAREHARDHMDARGNARRVFALLEDLAS